MKRTVNPVWNYTFVYEDVSLQELSERALELTIWDHDRLSTNEFLGGIRFSLGTGIVFPFFFLYSQSLTILTFFRSISDRITCLTNFLAGIPSFLLCRNLNKITIEMLFS